MNTFVEIVAAWAALNVLLLVAWHFAHVLVRAPRARPVRLRPARIRPARIRAVRIRPVRAASPRPAGLGATVQVG